MQKPMFALVDCNNFYVSCERVFRPNIQNVPVVVLSNNDGCVISRSNEVKKLGIPMGTPAFKYKKLFEKHGVKLFSPNFELYGDMSERVMKTLRNFATEMEIYSIDEAFLTLPKMENDEYTDQGRNMYKTIYRNTGIPVSVGIAPTKTLTKIAGEIVKKNPHLRGVLNFNILKDPDSILEKMPVHDVWGIGRGFAKRLQKKGIHTIRDLKYADKRWIRKNLHIIGLRTVCELNGESCIPLEEFAQLRKSVLCSRSFSKEVRDLEELEESVSNFAATVGEKLRKDNLVASMLQVFIETNRFQESRFYSNIITVCLNHPTSYTPDLIAAAKQGLKEIYLPNRNYKRAGVLLDEIQCASHRQLDLFGENNEAVFQKKSSFMNVLDRINTRFGRGTVEFLAQGIQKTWQMKRLLKSPAYTTKWAELPVVKC